MTGDYHLLDMLKFGIGVHAGIPPGAFVLPVDAGSDPDVFVVGSGSTRCRIPFGAIASIDDAKPHGGDAITVRLGGGPSDRRETFCNSTADRFRREYKAWLDRVKQDKRAAAEKAFNCAASRDGFDYRDAKADAIGSIGFAKVVDSPAVFEDGRFRILERRDSASLLVPHRLTPAQFAAFAPAYLAWKSRQSKPKPEAKPDPDVFALTDAFGNPLRIPFARITSLNLDASAAATIRYYSETGERVTVSLDGDDSDRFNAEYAAWLARNEYFDPKRGDKIKLDDVISIHIPPSEKATEFEVWLVGNWIRLVDRSHLARFTREFADHVERRARARASL